jgi:competence protein ComEC
MHSRRVMGIAILVSVLLCAVVWQAALREDRAGMLKVSFLDVGQGDAIFIESPTGTQVLIDGGPDSTVLRRLGEVLPWYDRSIDLTIGTHPDADHIGGLIDVFSRYHVGMIMQSSVQGSTYTWNVFEREAGKETPHIVTAMRGQILDLGGGAYLEVLFPDRQVKNLETNTGCVVTRLMYGTTSFMFSCDAPQAIEKYLVFLDGRGLQSTVLKPGHHGSKTSTAPLWVHYVDPRYAVLSRGCNNKYGFPHQMTLDTLSQFNVAIEDTCTQGTITFISDGKHVVMR